MKATGPILEDEVTTTQTAVNVPLPPNPPEVPINPSWPPPNKVYKLNASLELPVYKTSRIGALIQMARYLYESDMMRGGQEQGEVRYAVETSREVHQLMESKTPLGELLAICYLAGRLESGLSHVIAD